MEDYSPEAVKRHFRYAQGFNDLFESFRIAMERGIGDIDVYRELLCNGSLKPDELLFFAKKLSEVFPHLAFDSYMWLADVFESRTPEVEAVELSFLCLKKASEYSPAAADPYLAACEIYNQDLKIPTLQSIISFLRIGVDKVADPSAICERLSVFYKSIGNDEMADYYKRKSHRQN